MSNNITKNEIGNPNHDYADNDDNLTLILDYEEYKLKYLENKKNALENYISDNKISDKEKIIKFLESEFYFLQDQQKAIYYSNVEMKKYLTEEDEELNEFRAENMKIIYKNFERMKKIKSDILGLDRNHNIKDKDLLFFYKNLDKDIEEFKVPKNNPFIVEFIDRSGNHDTDAAENNNDYDTNDELEIIKEINL